VSRELFSRLGRKGLTNIYFVGGLHFDAMSCIIVLSKGRNMKEQYLNLLGDFNKLSDWIDSLSHEQRIELRNELEVAGCNKLARNLYYDYDKQCWI
jgi:hypothetical protein